MTLLGAVLGERFLIEGACGSGGHGEVFRALDLERHEPVALKRAWQANGSGADALRNEAVLLSAIHHPHIVRAFGSGQDESGRPWLALEWVEGGDLEARLLHAPLSTTEALALGLGVAAGLAHAHSLGLVHRDLKPQNVLLRSGDPAQPVLIDFGLAWHESQAAPLASMHVVRGTPHYMAPEQARALTDGKTPPPAAELYPRADLHALGAVLYAALTGQPPYRGEHVLAILAKVLLEPPPKLSDACRMLPRGLSELVCELLAKDAAKRPASAQQVRERLLALDSDALAASLPAPSLLPSEQAQVCALLVSHPGGRARAHAATLEGHGAEVQQLDERLDLAVFMSGDTSSERTLRAANCASSLSRDPQLAMTLVTGRGRPDSGSLVGEVIDRALLLHRADAAGQVAVDGTSAGLIEGRYLLESQGPRRLLGERRHGSGQSSMPIPAQVPFVGRDEELATFEDVFQDCRQSTRSRALLWIGEAGVGKSRLFQQFATSLEGHATLLFAHSDPVRGEAAYALVEQLLERLLALPPRHDRESRRKALHAWTAERFEPDEAARVAVFAGEMVGAPFDDEALPILRDVRKSPRALQDQVRHAFEQLFDAASRDSTIVLFIHDLQWADPPSVELLHALLRNLDERPLLVVANARPEVDVRFDPLWPDAQPRRIRLSSLPSRSCRQLVKQIGATLDRNVMRGLLQRCQGNPFYLLEFLRQLDPDTGALPTPKSVLSLVADRISACDPLARQLLRVASVFGDSFWRGALSDLLELPEADVARLLGALVDAQLVLPYEPSRFEDELEFRFSHALVREAAAESLVAAEVAPVHREAAHWLERHGERNPLVLAEHLRQAGLPKQAYPYYYQAAQKALATGDLPAVVQRAERAHSCGAEGSTAGQLWLLQAEALNWQGLHTQALSASERAIQNLTPGSADWAEAIKHTTWAAMIEGQADRVLGLSRELLEKLPNADEVEERHVSALAHCATVLSQATPGGERELVEQVRRFCARSEVSLALQVDISFMEVSLQRAGILKFQGYRECASVCVAVGHERMLSLCHGNLAICLLECGQYADALEAHAAALRTARRAGVEGPLASPVCYELAAARLGRPVDFSAWQRAQERAQRTQFTAASRTYLAVWAYEREAYDESLTFCESVLADTDSAGWFELHVVASAVRCRSLWALRRADEAHHAADVTRASLSRQRLVQFAEFEPLVQLALAEDEHATGLIAVAHVRLSRISAQLQQQADAFGRPEWSRNFLNDVPEHRRILELVALWDDEARVPP